MKDWKAVAKENGIYNDLFMRRVRDQGWAPEKAATTPPRKPRHENWLKVAEGNGISQSTFYSRINRSGWTPEKAATGPKLKMTKRPKGKWYKRAMSNGISEDTYYYRIENAGWSPEKAATTPVYKRPDTEFVKLAEQNGIHRRTYSSRVDDRFWEPEEASTVAPATMEEMADIMAETNRQYARIRHDRINNDPNNLFKLTPQMIEEAEDQGISEGTVEARIYRYGWTVQEAISVPVRKWEDRPSDFEEWLEIARQNAIPDSTFRGRIRSGWGLEDAACKKPDRTRTRVHSRKHLNIAEQNGIPGQVYRRRIKRGWTEDEASNIPLLKSGEFKDEEMKEKVQAAFKKFRTGKNES